jgi:hypothetical protein
MASIFEKLRNRITASSQKQRQTYSQIVREIACDREPGVDVVEAALAAAEKTADVATYRNRTSLAAQVGKIPERMREKQEAEAAVAKLNADFERVQAKHETAADSFYLKIRWCNEQIAAAEGARRELIGTCTDPAILAEHKAAMDEHQELCARRGEIRENLSSVRERIPRDSKRELLLESTPLDKEAEADMARYKAREQELERAMNDLDNKIARAEKRMNEAEAKRALP